MNDRSNRKSLLSLANASICLALFISAGSLNAQTIMLTSYGANNQDAGIDVIDPNHPISFEWSQSVNFSDVSIIAGLASFASTGTGWATITSGGNQFASTDFNYPNSYGRVDLFDGLNLPSGTYNLTVGALSGQDDGWGVPVAETVYTADNVSFDGVFDPWGASYPVDILIVSVPEPPSGVIFWLAPLLIAGLWRRTTASQADTHNRLG
jgi:hypothetical protein